MLFSLFSRQYLGLKTIKIKTALTIFYVYYNRSFSQNLNLWLLDKSEMINLQMLIQKNTFSVLSSSSPFEKTCSAMSASVSLVWTPFWHMRKPGILSCENVPGVPRPFCFNFLYFHRKVNTFKTPKMCLYVWARRFTIIFAGSLHYFKQVSCWILLDSVLWKCHRHSRTVQSTSITREKGKRF